MPRDNLAGEHDAKPEVSAPKGRRSKRQPPRPEPRQRVAPPPRQPDRVAPPPASHGTGRTVTTDGPGRPVPLETRANLVRPGSTPEFMRSQGGAVVTLPVLNRPTPSISPDAQAALRRVFGVYEHPLPADPEKRRMALALGEAYKRATGRNLRQERDMADALARAGLADPLFGDPQPHGQRVDNDQGASPWFGFADQETPESFAEHQRRRGFVGEGLRADTDQSDGIGLPRFRMPGVFAGRGGGNQFGGGQTLQGDELARPTPQNFARAASEISAMATRRRITVPHGLWDRFGVAEAFAAGQKPSQAELDELEKTYGRFGILSDEARAAFAKNARANGWSENDVAGLSDTELIEKAASGNVGTARRMLANLGGEVAALGAAPLGVAALVEAGVDSVQQRSPDPLATTIQEGFVDPTLRVFTDPGGSLVDAPLSTATTVLGAGRLVGGAARLATGGRLMGAGARRVTLPERFDSPQTGEPLAITHGDKSPNAIVRPVQAFADAARGRSDYLAGRLVAREAERGAATADHLGRHAGAERARPLLDAVKGLDEKQRMAVEYWAVPGRDPSNTVRVFSDKLERNPKSPNARYWAAQVETARIAEQVLGALPHDRVAAVRDAARAVEEANGADLERLGLTRETLDERLWDVVIREHPEYGARVAARLEELRQAKREGRHKSADGYSWAANADRRAAALEQKAAKVSGRTPASRAKRDRLTNQAAELRRDATNLRREANEQPTEVDIDQARRDVAADLRTELQREGVEPAMWMPHTPASIGRGGALRPSKPLPTGDGGARDLLGGRLEARSLGAYETGRLVSDPRTFEAAAGAPARAITTADEMQRRVAERLGHRIDLSDEDAASFDFDPDHWVIAQTGDVRRGATRTDPRVAESRQTEIADLMRRVDAGDAEAAKELTRRTFRVVERDPQAGRPQLGAGTYFAIPRAAWDALEQRAADAAKQGGKTAAVARAWRTSALNTLPRTAVNNIVGSIPMAAAGGVGALSYGRAVGELARRGGRGVPGELRGVGLAGGGTRAISLGDSVPGRIAAGWMNTMRKGNVFGEDAARAAVFLRGAHKAANEAAGRKWFAGVRGLNDDARQVLEGWARDPASRPPEVEQFVKKSEQFLGNLSTGGRTLGVRDDALAVAIPFHRWYRHIVRLTLATMPVEHPGRALFLQQLGELGDDYRREHGVWPSWARDIVPVGAMGKLDRVGKDGKLQEVLRGVDTGSTNPFATVGEVFPRLVDSDGETTFRGVLGGIVGGASPVVRTPVELAYGQPVSGPFAGTPFRDSEGDAIELGSGEWMRLAGNRFRASIPLAEFVGDLYTAGRGIETRPGEADDTAFWAPRERHYAMPPGMKGPLPSDYKPSRSRPAGLVETLLAGVGAPIGQVEGRGPRTRVQLAKQIGAEHR